MPARSLLYALAAAALLAAFAAGYWLLAPPPQPANTTLLPEPRPLPDVALVDQDGQAWSPHSMQGRWHVLFFGFTHCPDVCPITLGVMASALRQIEETARPAPKGVFVSVDPARDGVDEVREYAAWFHEDFAGITGEPHAIDRFARAAAIGVQRHEADEDGDYMVDHTASLVLIDPQGRLAGYMTPPLDPATVASDLQILTRHYSR